MLGDSLKRRNPSSSRRFARPSAQTIRRGWPFWLALTLSAIAIPFFAGYLVASVLLFPAPEAAEAGIAVPRLTGLPLAEAQASLRAAGLGNVEVTELPHPSAPQGVVTAQAPLPGQQLRAGAGVRVALSAGVPRVVVPDVVGFSADRAESLLARLGFDVDRQEQFASEDSGRVLRIEPRPRTEWPLPTTAHILVSIGPEFPDTVFAPDPLLRPDTLFRPDTLPRMDTLPPFAHRGASVVGAGRPAAGRGGLVP